MTIRTLDAGGDKPIPGLTVEGESNPFLGVRGLRLSFARPDVFRVQLRALARAAVHGELKIMLPMVTLPRELAAARAMLDEEVARCARRRFRQRARVSASWSKFRQQRSPPTCSTRTSSRSARTTSRNTWPPPAATSTPWPISPTSCQPAMLRLLTIRRRGGAAAETIEVSLCGDAGGDPRAIPPLLATGLRCLSMAPTLVGHAKLAIAAIDLDTLPVLAPWPR